MDGHFNSIRPKKIGVKLQLNPSNNRVDFGLVHSQQNLTHYIRPAGSNTQQGLRRT